MIHPFAGLQTRFFAHFQTPFTPQAAKRAAFPVAYTRQQAPAAIQKADLPALRSSYDALTAGGCTPVHFVCNGCNATVTRAIGNQFDSQQPGDEPALQPSCQERHVWMSPSGVLGRNGNTGQLLGHDAQQVLIQAAKFALGNGYVRNTPFATDIRMNGL